MTYNYDTHNSDNLHGSSTFNPFLPVRKHFGAGHVIEGLLSYVQTTSIQFALLNQPTFSYNLLSAPPHSLLGLYVLLYSTHLHYISSLPLYYCHTSRFTLSLHILQLWDSYSFIKHSLHIPFHCSTTKHILNSFQNLSYITGPLLYLSLSIPPSTII